MKLILSRKGFDSSAGGVPSPILPDGRLLPMPIPQTDGPLRYADLSVDGRTLSSLVKQLGGKGWRGRCHLDPDLDRSLAERHPDWLPAFGQFGSAQRHLMQEGVGPGDLFLFFGWFRQTEWVDGKLRFVKNAPDLHVLHSWLQIGQILPVTPQLADDWPGLAMHPHLCKDYPFNTIYLPAEQLEVQGELLGAGSGMFGDWRPERQLTWPGELRSVWQLPECLAPENSQQVLSYHRNLERWSRQEGQLRLNAAYRGQEFVVESAQPVEVLNWLKKVGFQ